MVVERIRAALLPYVTGKTGCLGAEWAQNYRCGPLDLFFRHFPFLGSGIHYDILIPFHAFFLGDTATLQLLLSLSLSFFTCNALKDILKLPRPKAQSTASDPKSESASKSAVVALESDYLEEYGFPSTHTAAGIVWTRALAEVLRSEILIPGFVAFAVHFYAIGGAFDGDASLAASSLEESSAAIASSAGMALLRTQAAGAAGMYASLVSFSRLYLGVHSLADLAGGIQVGILSVLLCDLVVMPAFLEFATGFNALAGQGGEDGEGGGSGGGDGGERGEGGGGLGVGGGGGGGWRVHFLGLWPEVAVPMPLVASACLVLGLVALFPDKRPGRTSYKDVLTMVGVAGGGAGVIASRLAARRPIAPLAPLKRALLAQALFTQQQQQQQQQQGFGGGYGSAAGGGGGGGGGLGVLGGSWGIWAGLLVSVGCNYLLLGILSATGGAAVDRCERWAGFRGGAFRLARYVAMGAFVAAAADGGTCHLNSKWVTMTAPPGGMPGGGSGAGADFYANDETPQAPFFVGLGEPPLDCSALFGWFGIV